MTFHGSDWLKWVHHKMSLQTVHSFMVLAQISKFYGGFLCWSPFSPLIGAVLIFLRTFCSHFFKFFSFLYSVSSLVPPVNGPFGSERAVQLFQDGPPWPTFHQKLLFLARPPFITHFSRSTAGFQFSFTSVRRGSSFLHFIFIFSEYWASGVSTPTCVPSSLIPSMNLVLISTMLGFPMELGEFDSYEAYLADLGVSLCLLCLFHPIESSVALIHYAF